MRPIWQTIGKLLSRGKSLQNQPVTMKPEGSGFRSELHLKALFWTPKEICRFRSLPDVRRRFFVRFWAARFCRNCCLMFGPLSVISVLAIPLQNGNAQ